MATLEIGIRIDLATGIGYFGVEEVNRRIAAGARVVELRPGGAILDRAGADGPTTLAGCQFVVVLEDA